MSAATVTLIILSFLMPSVVVIGLETNEFFPEERNALMQLRDIVNSTSNLHANWTGPTCSNSNQSRWSGIACSDWHVVHLVLEGIQLTGSLPSMFLHNLTFLTKLSFSNNSLQGPLPNLTNLIYLEYVFMSRNHFSGSIPFGYIDLPKLTKLELQENDLTGEIPPFNQQTLIGFNVSNNKLEGPIPQTPVLERFPMSSYANNSDLCGDILLSPCPIVVPPPSPAPSPWVPSRKKDDGGLKLWSIALIAAGGILVPLSLIFMFLCYNRRAYGRKTKKDRDLPEEVTTERRVKWSHWSGSTDDEEITVELEFLEKPMFDLDDLLRAAAEELGRGKLGTTYKAMLECGTVVAVKRLKEQQTSKKEFVQQMHLLGSISKHENLAEIISFHQSKEEKLIIYEYVPDCSLYTLLHENRGIGARVALDWRTRVMIIKEIAKGVEYLHQCLASHHHHHHHHQRVPHGNLKSSNVLIQRLVNDDDDDDDYTTSSSMRVRVKLTDYGLVPVVPAHKLWVRETPEFGEGLKKMTSKADVYCFGILVLEIVTGRVPTPQLQAHSSSSNAIASTSASTGEGDLSGWVRAAVNNDWSTDILDLEIIGDKNGYDDMLKLTEIGLDCTDASPEKRPTMTQVLATLQHIS